MINIEKTIELFGYNPDSLKLKSHKLVVHNCGDCGKERIMRKEMAVKTCFCKQCSKKNKNNPHYKDGRCLVKKYCAEPGCNKQIKYTATYCSKHANIGIRNPNYKGEENTKKYFCIDCGGAVSSLNTIRCKKCYIIWKKVNVKNPIKYCKFCGIKIDYRSTMCKSCNSGENNNKYKDGRASKQYYCKYPECNNKICLTSALYGNGFCNLHSQMGENHPQYIDGRTPIANSIRGLRKYTTWRTDVFRRDNYICQDCGSSKSGTLEAHHKKEFHILLTEFLKEYDQFSPVEDKETLARLATKWKPFWDINNGLTLCQECHKAIRRTVK